MFLGEILCPELIPKFTLLKNLDVQLTLLKTYLVKGERPWGHNTSCSSPYFFSRIPIIDQACQRCYIFGTFLPPTSSRHINPSISITFVILPTYNTLDQSTVKVPAAAFISSCSGCCNSQLLSS